MNSRERVITALNHREPDRVPIDLNGTMCTALTKTAYNNLRNYLGLKKDENPNISNLFMGSVRAREDVLEIYDIDTRTIYMNDLLESKEEAIEDNSFEDDFGIIWKQASFYYDAVSRPLKLGTVEELNKAKWENYNIKDRVIGLKEKASILYETTDFCLVADMHTFGPFEGGCMLRGYDNFLIDLASNEKYAMALLEKLTETVMTKWSILLDEIGDYVQVVAQGDDLGMQTSTYISPEMYHKFIKPFHKKLFDLIHSKTRAKVFLHSCGSVYDLIPDFIETGVDILNPIQRSAAKMDILKLKKEFGKELSFWGGGIDVQKQLPFYSLKLIEEEIKRTMEIMAPGGGFVFFPSHNIQADVSPEKINCLFKCAFKYGS
ncbi:MAG: uroporphyrinogen decarboxylase family protein [Candidatus Humimicrobiaceae bacterium]